MKMIKMKTTKMKMKMNLTKMKTTKMKMKVKVTEMEKAKMKTIGLMLKKKFMKIRINLNLP